MSDLETSAVETVEKTAKKIAKQQPTTNPLSKHSSEQPSVEQTPVEGETPLTKLEGETPPRTKMKGETSSEPENSSEEHSVEQTPVEGATPFTMLGGETAAWFTTAFQWPGLQQPGLQQPSNSLTSRSRLVFNIPNCALDCLQVQEGQPKLGHKQDGSPRGGSERVPFSSSHNPFSHKILSTRLACSSTLRH